MSVSTPRDLLFVVALVCVYHTDNGKWQEGHKHLKNQLRQSAKRNRNEIELEMSQGYMCIRFSPNFSSMFWSTHLVHKYVNLSVGETFLT